jgi:hypothetical protein
MIMSLSKEDMEHFLHGQLDAWNKKDKAAFFAHYHAAAPNGLTIEYVGRPLSDPWKILEDMWNNNNAAMTVEAIHTVINGDEAACYHHNKTAASNIKTIEIYAFKDGALHVRYFIPG